MEQMNDETLKTFIDMSYYTGLDDYVRLCKDECRMRLEDVRNVERAIKTFEDCHIDYSVSKTNDVIDALRKTHSEKEEYLKQVQKLIEEKRISCEHDWKYDGHDSHYDYYVCKKCGKTERW